MDGLSPGAARTLALCTLVRGSIELGRWYHYPTGAPTYDFIAPYLKSDRQGFNASEFALNVGLDGPVGGTYFTVEA